jgi:hypothetical protein
MYKINDKKRFQNVLISWLYDEPQFYLLVFFNVTYLNRSRESVVGIATGYGLDERGVGFRVPVESRIFSTSSRSALGTTQPPLQWVPAALRRGVKRPGREADHSPPASAEVKKM